MKSDRKAGIMRAIFRFMTVFFTIFLPLIWGCKTLNTITDIGTSVAVSTGVISETQGDAISKTTKAVAKTFEDITPEQEYYIGRTVGAMIMNRYKAYENSSVNRYVNVLGQTLAQASDMPETYGGYHFLVLDSSEINAFAAPGGLIFVTRGLLRCCKSEGAVAAVLAHEIGHVQHQHGLQAIDKSRLTTALTTIGTQAARVYGPKELSELTSHFEDAVSDVISTMVNSGYSRSFERQADQASVKILKNVGYSPQALVDMLNVMDQQLKPGGLDFAKTHPSPESRISDIKGQIGETDVSKRSAHRNKRFMAAMRNI